MESLAILKLFALALALGVLVGLQREWDREGRHATIAGIRTFALITLLGAMLVLLGQIAFAVGLAGVIAYFILGNLGRYWQGSYETGMTTEFAAMVMYAVGGAVLSGYTAQAVVVAGVVAILLHYKGKIHDFVNHLSHKDFRGIIQLVLIGLVILPVLPDQPYGPYEVLVPYRIWLMVVLIVGISLAAYAAYRILGARAGSVLGGILGGFISSTATTVSYARQTKNAPDAAPLAALVILIASTVVNVRVLIEIGAVAPGFLKVAVLPIGTMLALMVIICLLLLWKVGRNEGLDLDHDNPAQLKAALIFGALYAVIIFVVAAVKEQFGEQALYIVAIISGLTDVDAMTLSTAEMVDAGRVTADTGWRVVMVAAMSNLVFKAGAAAILGNLRLGKWVGMVFGASLAGGLAIVLLWPATGSAIPESDTKPRPPQQQTQPLVPSGEHDQDGSSSPSATFIKPQQAA